MRSSAVGSVMIATSEHQYFSSDSVKAARDVAHRDVVVRPDRTARRHHRTGQLNPGMSRAGGGRVKCQRQPRTWLQHSEASIRTASVSVAQHARIWQTGWGDPRERGCAASQALRRLHET
jgi:hypothetical protein